MSSRTCSRGSPPWTSIRSRAPPADISSESWSCAVMCPLWLPTASSAGGLGLGEAPGHVLTCLDEVGSSACTTASTSRARSASRIGACRSADHPGSAPGPTRVMYVRENGSRDCHMPGASGWRPARRCGRGRRRRPRPRRGRRPPAPRRPSPRRSPAARPRPRRSGAAPPGGPRAPRARPGRRRPRGAPRVAGAPHAGATERRDLRRRRGLRGRAAPRAPAPGWCRARGRPGSRRCATRAGSDRQDALEQAILDLVARTLRETTPAIVTRALARRAAARARISTTPAVPSMRTRSPVAIRCVAIGRPDDGRDAELARQDGRMRGRCRRRRSRGRRSW